MNTLVADILAAWRRAERLTNECAPGTPEHSAALVASERLRDLYQHLTASLGAADEVDARAHLAELDVGGQQAAEA